MEVSLFKIKQSALVLQSPIFAFGKQFSSHQTQPSPPKWQLKANSRLRNQVAAVHYTTLMNPFSCLPNQFTAVHYTTLMDAFLPVPWPMKEYQASLLLRVHLGSISLHGRQILRPTCATPAETISIFQFTFGRHLQSLE